MENSTHEEICTPNASILNGIARTRSCDNKRLSHADQTKNHSWHISYTNINVCVWVPFSLSLIDFWVYLFWLCITPYNRVNPYLYSFVHVNFLQTVSSSHLSLTQQPRSHQYTYMTWNHDDLYHGRRMNLFLRFYARSIFLSLFLSLWCNSPKP